MSKLMIFLNSILLSILFCLPTYGQQAAGKIVEGTVFPGIYSATNYIKNPSAINNASFGTNTSSATLSKDTDTADKLDGKSSFICDSSSQNGYCEWLTDTIQEGDKTGNCAAVLQYKGDASLYKVQIHDGSNTLNSSLVLSNVTDWTWSDVVTYPCGSTRRVRFTQTESGTGAAVNVGRVYYGRNIGLSQVSQAEVAVSLISTASLSITHNTETKLTFGSTLTTNKLKYFTLSSGTLTATTAGEGYVNCAWEETYTSDAATIRHMRSSVYKNGSAVRPGGYIGGLASNAVESKNPVSSASSYVSWSANDTIECYAYQSNASGTSYNTAKQYVEILSFPTSSQSGLTPNTTPAYWSGYHDTTCLWSRTSGSLGDFTADASCALTAGSNISNITCTTSGSVDPALACTFPKAGTYEICAKVNSFTGTSDAGAFLSLTDGTTIYDQRIYQNGTGYTPVNLCGQVAVTGTTKTVKIQGAATSGSITLTGGSPNRSSIEWTVLDISQNFPAPLLVGSVTSNSAGAERIERVSVTGATCTSSPCTISSQTGSWVSSITRNSTGNYTVNINSGMFSAAPFCWAQAYQGTNNPIEISDGNQVPTTTSFRFQCNRKDTDAADDCTFGVGCMGPK